MTLDIARILVPHDFSSNSARALDYAYELGKKFGASLHLVHVCELPTMLSASMDGFVGTANDLSRELGEEGERDLAAIAAPYRDVRVTTEVLFGSPAKAIAESAMTNRADLIVMGTHGHGPVLHVVMGNVAERVVRTAPCPVLTVREPRVREVEKMPTMKLATMAGALLFASVLLAPGAAAAQSAEPQQQMQQSVPGSEVYRTYCASCHGVTALGDGTLASAMTKKPANLTEIAKRNGGVYPSELVFKVIDGREKVRGHGGADMPVWGDAFKRSRDGGDEDRIKAVIKSLVDYLERIQLRPVH